MFDIKYLILDEDKDILCNIKNVEEYELEISSITGQLEFICNGNSHGFVYPDAPCNDEFLLEWFIELNSVIISLKSNSFVTMMIPCIINRWLEFKSIDEMILITKISAKPVMPILEYVVNTPIERDEIFWSEYIPRDEFISKTLEITDEFIKELAAINEVLLDAKQVIELKNTFQRAKEGEID